MPAHELSEESDLPWKSPLATVAILLALCLVSFALKGLVAAGREVPGHGDVSHYFALARNLAEGRGMWMASLSTWLGEPTGLPVYGASYWMPLPAWIAELGMRWRGETSFEAAGLGMIALTSLVPLLTYLLGRDLLGSARAGLVGALLATSFHLFLDKASLPLTHGGVLVFGGFALWAIVRSLESPRHLWLAGLFIAASQLNRSDGLLWLPVLLVAHRLRPGGPTPLRQLWPALAAYAISIGPFLYANFEAIGRLWPGSLLDVALLPSYPWLYALPERLTLDAYLAPGLASILGDKLAVGGTNALATLTGLASSGRIGASENLATYVPHALALFAWIGARPLFRRKLAAFWCYLLLEWALYSLVFTHTGHTSFESILYAIYPLLLVLAARGSWILLAGLREPFLSGSPIKRWAFAFAWILFALANFHEAELTSERRIRANANLASLNRAQVNRLIRRNDLEREIFMVNPGIVHSLHAHTRIKTVSIPYMATAEDIWIAGTTAGVTHLLLTEKSPTPKKWNLPAIIEESEFFLPIDEVELSGTLRKLYRLRPRSD